MSIWGSKWFYMELAFHLRHFSDVTLRNVDLRGHASAKNAQIRRRMSLQMLKSRNVEISEETRQIKVVLS